MTFPFNPGIPAASSSLTGSLFPMNVTPTESSGGYYGPIMGEGGYLYNGQVCIVDLFYAIPFITREGGAVTSLNFGNLSAAENGRLIRSGIYNDTPSAPGAPGTLVAEASLTTLTAAAALRSATITATLSPNTLYWFAFLANGAFTMTCLQFFSNSAVFEKSPGTAQVNNSAFGNIWHRSGLDPGSSANMGFALTRALAYAALPATWGTPSGFNGQVILTSWKKT